MLDFQRNLILFVTIVLLIAIGCGPGDEASTSEPCSVVQEDEGTATIICPDGSEATLSGGTDGSSCSAVDNEDGTKTIACEDGTEVIVSDGESGNGCTVDEHDDGTATISCEDSENITVPTAGNCSTMGGSLTLPRFNGHTTQAN